MARHKKTSSHDAALERLRAFGLRYPGTHYKSPWPGHKDLAVNDKTFAYLGLEGEPLSISCKLPDSCAAALLLPFTKPTAYGLGKSGWVTANFEPSDTPPVDMLEAWIDESYRAQAPKKLVKLLDADHAPTSTPRAETSTKKKATKKKSTKKKSTKKKSTKKKSTKKKSAKKKSAKKKSTTKKSAKKKSTRGKSARR